MRSLALAFAVVLVLAAPSGAVAPPSSADVAQAELQHTQLDNARLRRDASFWSTVQRWLPGGSAIVAALALGVGFWRYLDERRRDRRLKIEESINHNLERIVDRPAGQNARVIAALRSLDALAPADPGCRDRKNLPTGARQRVTDAVEAIVRHELLSFDAPDQALLARIFVQEWQPFAGLVANDETLNEGVLHRYKGALTAFEIRKPREAAALSIGLQGEIGGGDLELGIEDATLMFAVVTGYSSYTALLQDAGRQGKARAGLGEALHNKTIVAQLWPSAASAP